MASKDQPKSTKKPADFNHLLATFPTREADNSAVKEWIKTLLEFRGISTAPYLRPDGIRWIGLDLHELSREKLMEDDPAVIQTHTRVIVDSIILFRGAKIKELDSKESDHQVHRSEVFNFFFKHLWMMLFLELAIAVILIYTSSKSMTDNHSASACHYIETLHIHNNYFNQTSGAASIDLSNMKTAADQILVTTTLNSEIVNLTEEVKQEPELDKMVDESTATVSSKMKSVSSRLVRFVQEKRQVNARAAPIKSKMLESAQKSRARYNKWSRESPRAMPSPSAQVPESNDPPSLQTDRIARSPKVFRKSGNSLLVHFEFSSFTVDVFADNELDGSRTDDAGIND
ncbi:hypothetical protein HYFRA_00013120 [Hymenoscyphus fraxineus]|uniref:Uncharacterized protein n=1 Tax=Hymenoscyphus fraxineus TaxID=746836 RepID=A0A9N9L5A5_9HELO|nr:hypothetical protein HYFRA_00013120 [Hymenoscyphus fraxineus]